MRTILDAPSNPALRAIARPLTASEISSDRIRALISEMKALLAQEKFGVALAAPQVGESIRLFIVAGRALAKRARAESDEAGEAPDPAIPIDEVYINPEIIKTSRGRKDKHEGCLSIRGKWGMVPRAEKVTLKALDEQGRPVLRGASGFLAHIFQHEMDHLEGILYVDKANELYDEDPESDE